MTYATQNASIHDSQPIECYKFVGPGGIFRYCTNDEDALIEVRGETFVAMNITRNSIDVNLLTAGPKGLEIEVPIDCDLAIEHAYVQSPQQLTLEIIRVERGTSWVSDYQVIYKGEANSFRLNGDMITIQFGNVFQNQLENEVNIPVVQFTCNHKLYDARCQANQAAHTVSATVTIVGPDAVTVNNDGFADHALKAGTAHNTRTGEDRLIVDNVANTINLGFGFSDVIVGDVVNLIRGCLHNPTDCISTFANFIHYGGHRHVPDSNPYIDGLR